MLLQETPLSAEDVSLWSDPLQIRHQDTIMVQDDIIELPTTLDSNTENEEPQINNNAPTTKSEVPNTYIFYLYIELLTTTHQILF